jgi:hypothetical protein
MAEHTPPEPPQGGPENPEGVPGQHIPSATGDELTPPQGYQPPPGYHPPQNHPGETAWGAAPTANPAPGTGAATTPKAKIAPWKKVAGAVVLVAVVGVGGFAAVTAANASDSGSAQTAPGGSGAGGYGSAGFGPGGQAGDGTGGSGAGMPGGFGGPGGVMALAGALHGEFVVQTQAGGTQTERLQSGSVTAVAAGSLSVTSTDGFAATYVIGSDVDVSGIAVGDTVRVIATVDGDTVTATSVQAETGAMGGQGAAGGALPGGTAPTAAPQTS